MATKINRKDEKFTKISDECKSLREKILKFKSKQRKLKEFIKDNQSSMNLEMSGNSFAVKLSKKYNLSIPRQLRGVKNE